MKQVDTFILMRSFDSRKKEAESHCFVSFLPAATLAVKLASRRARHNVLKILPGFISQHIDGLCLWSISSNNNFSLSLSSCFSCFSLRVWLSKVTIGQQQFCIWDICSQRGGCTINSHNILFINYPVCRKDISSDEHSRTIQLDK